jgi:prolipoprotein diacylglyceryltransferase
MSEWRVKINPEPEKPNFIFTMLFCVIGGFVIGGALLPNMAFGGRPQDMTPLMNTIASWGGGIGAVIGAVVGLKVWSSGQG